MSKDVSVHFYRPYDEHRQPWAEVFPGGDVAKRVAALLRKEQSNLQTGPERYLLARPNGKPDAEAAHIELYSVRTTDWPYFASLVDVGPIDVPDDPNLGIAHATAIRAV